MAHRDEILSERLAYLMASMCDVILPALEIQDHYRLRGEFTTYEVDKIDRLDLQLGELRLILRESIQNWQAGEPHPLGETVVYARRPITGEYRLRAEPPDADDVDAEMLAQIAEMEAE